MRKSRIKSRITFGCLAVLLLPAFTACEDHYVHNNGVRYYDANESATDSMPSQPYTKNGMYYTNPEEATNTRDNRGMRVPGYGHDTDDDFRNNYTDYPNHSTTVYTTGPDGRTVVQTTTTTY